MANYVTILFGFLIFVHTVSLASDAEFIVSYDNLGLTDFPADIPLNVTLLLFSGNRLTRLSTLSLPELRNCTDLILNSNAIETVDPQFFSNVKHLKRLQLHNNSLAQLKSKMFAEVMELTDVRVSSNYISWIPRGSFSRLWNLEILTLSQNALTYLDINIFRDLTSLKYLDLSNNRLKVMTYRQVSLPQLRVVILFNNPLLINYKDYWNNNFDACSNFYPSKGKILDLGVWLAQPGCDVYDNGLAIRETCKTVVCISVVFISALAIFMKWFRSRWKSWDARDDHKSNNLPCLYEVIIEEIKEKEHRVQQLSKLIEDYMELHGQLPNVKPNKPEVPQCHVTFTRGRHTFAGVRVRGEPVILQAPGSSVQLVIPSGSHGFVLGHAHTDIKSFPNVIPETECVVAPVVEYKCFAEFATQRKKFKIKIPHCMESAVQAVTVRHGDIHTKRPFLDLPTSSFQVDEQCITISTSSFSQFVCTSCDWKCYGQGKAFIFGNILDNQIPTASLRLYICSPLYKIPDYQKTVSDMERECGRSLVALDGLRWTPEECTKTDQCGTVDITVQANDWIPRSVKTLQTWNPELHTMIHTLDTGDLYDLFLCHNCKSDPTIVTTFDFKSPGGGGAGTGGHPCDVRFTALMEMLHKNMNLECVKIFETHIDIKTEEASFSELNKDHMMLRDVTRELITNNLDLHVFGLHLGVTYHKVAKIRTNNPHSIEGAALNLACEWWGSSSDSREQKVKVILESVKKLDKDKLMEKIEKIVMANQSQHEENCSTYL